MRFVHTHVCPQFRNFVANSLRISLGTVEQIWDFLKGLRDKQQAAKDDARLLLKQAEANKTKNNDTTTVVKATKDYEEGSASANSNTDSVSMQTD